MSPNYIDKQSDVLMGLDGDVWYDYYRKVAVDPSLVRKACHAKMKVSASHSKAIVIVHGIADSPFSQADIANIFFEMGYDVYLPLLSSHGLNNIESMHGVSYQDWLANVVSAIELLDYDHVSISGFSLGGLIAFYMSQKKQLITGKTYLFSTPFQFKQQRGGILGKIQQFYVNHFNRFPLEYIKKRPLIDEMNPYIYEYIDIYALRELIKLQNMCVQIIAYSGELKGNIYAYHSEYDTRASSEPLKTLAKQRSNVSALIFDESKGIGHGAMVFKAPIYRLDGQTPKHIIERSNRYFGDLKKQIQCDEAHCF